ncbi:MAG: flippase-like domain-containing protein, partial [Chloroflexota bacterium]|nr:flippase-like domain-containing protein [Chloroflexota bacterium]
WGRGAFVGGVFFLAPPPPGGVWGARGGAGGGAGPTPGGLGAVEGGLLGLMRLIGVGGGVAGAVAIVDRVITYWSVILTGGLLFVFTRLKRR